MAGESGGSRVGLLPLKAKVESCKFLPPEAVLPCEWKSLPSLMGLALRAAAADAALCAPAPPAAAASSLSTVSFDRSITAPVYGSRSMRLGVFA